MDIRSLLTRAMTSAADRVFGVRQNQYSAVIQDLAKSSSSSEISSIASEISGSIRSLQTVISTPYVPNPGSGVQSSGIGEDRLRDVSIPDGIANQEFPDQMQPQGRTIRDDADVLQTVSDAVGQSSRVAVDAIRQMASRRDDSGISESAESLQDAASSLLEVAHLVGSGSESARKFGTGARFSPTNLDFQEKAFSGRRATFIGSEEPSDDKSIFGRISARLKESFDSVLSAVDSKLKNWSKSLSEVDGSSSEPAGKTFRETIQLNAKQFTRRQTVRARKAIRSAFPSRTNRPNRLFSRSLSRFRGRFPNFNPQTSSAGSAPVGGGVGSGGNGIPVLPSVPPGGGGGGVGGGNGIPVLPSVPPGGGGGGVGGGAAGAGAGAGGGSGSAAASTSAAGAVVVGSIVAAAAAFIALIAAVAIATRSLAKLGQQGYETALRVADYNGALVSAKVQLDVGRLMRDIETANDLGQSGSEFMNSLNELEEAIRPISVLLQDIGLRILTILVDIAASILRAINSVFVVGDNLKEVAGQAGGFIEGGIIGILTAMGQGWIAEILAQQQQQKQQPPQPVGPVFGFGGVVIPPPRAPIAPLPIPQVNVRP